MKKPTIAEIAMSVMFEQKETLIDMGKFGLLDDIYERCKTQEIFRKYKNHPLDRQAYIMAQLRKSKLFKRIGHIDYPGYGRSYANCSVLTFNSNV